MKSKARLIALFINSGSLPSFPNDPSCSILSCKAPKSFGTGFCELHGGKRSEKYKKNSKLYQSVQWKKLRQSVLSTQPICKSCLSRGIIKQSEAVDHVFPHRQDPLRFLLNIYQGLCVACHTQKTKHENDGVFIHYTQDGQKIYKDRDYASVMAEHGYNT